MVPAALSLELFKPVIGCTGGAVSCVIEAERDGLLVEARDAQALAQAICRLLAQPDEARALGEAGRQKVLARYTWPAIAARFRGVYREALGG